MTRAITLLVLLAAVVAPLAVDGPRTAQAATYRIRVRTVDANTNRLIAGACYSVVDRVDGGGGIGAACDADDGSPDGITILTAEDGNASFPYRVGQTLWPADYLQAVPSFIDTTPPSTLTFASEPKPFIVITTTDARTGRRVPGACVGVEDLNRGGGVDGPCDGNDGTLDGRITTTRLLAARYRLRARGRGR